MKTLGIGSKQFSNFRKYTPPILKKQQFQLLIDKKKKNPKILPQNSVPPDLSVVWISGDSDPYGDAVNELVREQPPVSGILGIDDIIAGQKIVIM